MTVLKIWPNLETPVASERKSAPLLTDSMVRRFPVSPFKRDILKLYENDFMKFDSSGRSSLIFDHIPAELQKNASRYQISSVIENARAGTMLERIAKLQDSKTVNIAYHANAQEAGLSQNIDLISTEFMDLPDFS